LGLVEKKFKKRCKGGSHKEGEFGSGESLYGNCFKRARHRGYLFGVESIPKMNEDPMKTQGGKKSTWGARRGTGNYMTLAEKGREVYRNATRAQKKRMGVQ